MAFRRRYFTSRAQLDRTLQAFLRFYTFHPPQHAYRCRSRTPAPNFHGAVAAAGEPHAPLWDGRGGTTNSALGSRGGQPPGWTQSFNSGGTWGTPGI